MGQCLNTSIWLDNVTKHFENAFTRHFYKLTRGAMPPRHFIKKYLYKAFSKYNLDILLTMYARMTDRLTRKRLRDMPIQLFKRCWHNKPHSIAVHVFAT